MTTDHLCRNRPLALTQLALLVLLLFAALMSFGCSNQPAVTATDTTATTTPAPAVLKPPVPMPIEVMTVTPLITTTTPITPTTPAVVPGTLPTQPGTAPLTGTATITLTIRDHALRVELATTPQQRQRGLMFREYLPADTGMLFVFPNDAARSFWMRNTQIPLSIAFLDAEGQILNILDMQPFDESSHPSAGPARYALEVNQGWFAERGIVAGDVCQFTIPPDVVVQ